MPLILLTLQARPLTCALPYVFRCPFSTPATTPSHPLYRTSHLQRLSVLIPPLASVQGGVERSPRRPISKFSSSLTQTAASARPSSRITLALHQSSTALSTPSVVPHYDNLRLHLTSLSLQVQALRPSDACCSDVSSLLAKLQCSSLNVASHSSSASSRPTYLSSQTF